MRPVEDEYDPVLAERLCAALRAGLTPEEACAALEVPLRQYYLWLRLAETLGTEEYREFRASVSEAKMKGESLCRLLMARDALLQKASFNRKRWPGQWPAVTNADVVLAGDQLSLL